MKTLTNYIKESSNDEFFSADTFYFIKEYLIENGTKDIENRVKLLLENLVKGGNDKFKNEFIKGVKNFINDVK